MRGDDRDPDVFAVADGALVLVAGVRSREQMRNLASERGSILPAESRDDALHQPILIGSELKRERGQAGCGRTPVVQMIVPARKWVLSGE